MTPEPARRTDQRLEITLLQERSAGTFARVYLAEARGSGGLSRVVAVKVIKEQWSDSAEILSRSRDEARLLSRLQHRNILRVEALAQVDGQPALVMEFVDGVDLRELILGLAERGERIPPRSLYTVLAAAASALAAAYEEIPLTMSGPLRVVHRDIKPSNIMISRQGEVKVLDFGTARFDLTERQASTGAMRFGSLKYMSPERRDGARGDHPSDVYALGLVALEMLLGELLPVLPVGTAEHDALLEDILGRLPDPGLPDARWDDALKQTLRGMVAADPARRLHASQVVPLFRSFADNATGESLEVFASRAMALLGHDPVTARPEEISGSRVFTAATTSSDLPPPATGRPRLSASRTMVPDPAIVDAATPVQVSVTADPIDEAPLGSAGDDSRSAPATLARERPPSPVTAGALPVRAATDPPHPDPDAG
ncbi:MAG: serine/threonine protein kinase, partial [Deltaproteobacteria bacterium]